MADRTFDNFDPNFGLTPIMHFAASLAVVYDLAQNNQETQHGDIIFFTNVSCMQIELMSSGAIVAGVAQLWTYQSRKCNKMELALRHSKEKTLDNVKSHMGETNIVPNPSSTPWFS